MTAEIAPEYLCRVIEGALKMSSESDKLSETLTMKSKMGSPVEWDSLSFVSVFVAISQAFGIELDDDDAIHFRDVESIYSFLKEST